MENTNQNTGDHLPTEGQKEKGEAVRSDFPQVPKAETSAEPIEPASKGLQDQSLPKDAGEGQENRTNEESSEVESPTDSQGEWGALNPDTPQPSDKNPQNQPVFSELGGGPFSGPPPSKDQLIQFTFEEYDIRAVRINGQPYFAAKDVCSPLGFKKPRNAVANHCKHATKAPFTINGVEQEMIVIPKGDVLRLICQSNKPEADKFERKVFDEWIPQIVETGSYKAPEPPQESNQIVEMMMAKLVQEMEWANSEIERLEKHRANCIKAMEGTQAVFEFDKTIPPIVAPQPHRKLEIGRHGIHDGSVAKLRAYLLKNHGRFTTREIAEKFDWSSQKAVNTIRALVQSGFVTVLRGESKGRSLVYFASWKGLNYPECLDM